MFSRDGMGSKSTRRSQLTIALRRGARGLVRDGQRHGLLPRVRRLLLARDLSRQRVALGLGERQERARDGDPRAAFPLDKAARKRKKSFGAYYTPTAVAEAMADGRSVPLSIGALTQRQGKPIRGSRCSASPPTKTPPYEGLVGARASARPPYETGAGTYFVRLLTGPRSWGTSSRWRSG